MLIASVIVIVVSIVFYFHANRKEEIIDIFDEHLEHETWWNPVLWWIVIGAAVVCLILGLFQVV